MGHYHYYAGEYCEECLPVPVGHNDVTFDSGEQDRPAHCCKCGRILEYSLTTDGVKYVLEHIEDELAKLKKLDSEAECIAYLTNAHRSVVVLDWAHDLRDKHYRLGQHDTRMLERFIRLCTNIEAHRSRLAV